MRNKISGFGISVLMVMAVGGLTAPPSFATDYFVKYLYQVHDAPLCGPQAPSGARHGSVVFKRTATTMSATVYLRGAAPNVGVEANLIGHSIPCQYSNAAGFTDSQGNATMHVGPEARKGKKAFFVHVTVGSTHYETGDVPAFGL